MVRVAPLLTHGVEHVSSGSEGAAPSGGLGVNSVLPQGIIFPQSSRMQLREVRYTVNCRHEKDTSATDCKLCLCGYMENNHVTGFTSPKIS